MIDIAIAHQMALSFTEVVETPHFEKTSFRIKKKIFATLDTKAKRVVLKLLVLDQSVFIVFDPAIIYPAPGHWGKHGWTIVELDGVEEDILYDALTVAYCTVAPKKLAEKYKL